VGRDPGIYKNGSVSKTYPIGSFQASSTILLFKCPLLLLLFPVVWSISGLLWIVLVLPDGTVGAIKKQEPTGRSLILVLKRSGNCNPVVVDKFPYRSSIVAPTVFASEEKKGLMLWL